MSQSENLVPVEDSESLVKDVGGSQAVIETDLEALRNAREIKKARLKEKERLDKVEKDVSDIKSMLQQILEKV